MIAILKDVEVVRFDFANPNNEFLVRIDGETQIVSFARWLEEQDEVASTCDIMDYAESHFAAGCEVEIERDDDEWHLVGSSWVLCDCNNGIPSPAISVPSVTCDCCGKTWLRK